MIRVRAKKEGFCGRLHKPGDEFSIPEQAFSKTWMERVEQKKPVGRPPKVDEKAEK